ncbi:MAG: quinone-dependent dihydroorotate dehydrogenase [Alphaproteobacteria bacterium]|nr:quinone-dependent dihydroorotate dehydrogenase [Alphaproteobacteria bacterium]
MKLLRVLSTLGRPVLTRLDPEFAHTLTINALSRFDGEPNPEPDDPRLRVQALGLDFPNPIGLAAGFDKNAAATEAMLSFGFGFVEAGTVTPRPQEGNPKPRIFRLREDRAVINRLGFNNEGLATARTRLTRLQGRAGIRGINIGANKDASDRVADYVTGLTELAPLASYVTVNISSPNTPGLRGLQNKSELQTLLTALGEARAKLPRAVPLLVKIAPDLDDHACADIAELALAHKLDGLIVSNTTIARPSTLKSRHANETGGLSGAPLFVRATAVLRQVRRLTQGKITLIGVGGISSGADAYAKIKAGATLVQLYTALTYEGPGLIARIKRELLACMDREGHHALDTVVGAPDA